MNKKKGKILNNTSISNGIQGSSEYIRALIKEDVIPQKVIIARTTCEDHSELALLSKRKARSILRIGSDSLNNLINKGDIKVILINNREKIPYVCLQDFVYKMSINKKQDLETTEFINEDESVAKAYKIITDINKGGGK